MNLEAPIAAPRRVPDHPMELQDVQALQTQVLWAAFAVSAAFGAIAQRTHFCTMGAISDIYNMGSWVRMRMWGMAVGWR